MFAFIWVELILIVSREKTISPLDFTSISLYPAMSLLALILPAVMVILSIVSIALILSAIPLLSRP